MIRLALALIPLALLTGAAPAADQPDAKAWQSLSGPWRMVQAVYTPNDGTTPVAELFHQLGKNVEIKDGWLRSLEPGNKMSFKLTIDPKQSPPAIDLQLPGEKDDEALHASYISGNGQLTLHIGIGEKRPRGRGNDGNQIMLVLVRPVEQ